jgi:HPt (histidine-containing phosphotransfer) domain-containing protein
VAFDDDSQLPSLDDRALDELRALQSPRRSDLVERVVALYLRDSAAFVAKIETGLVQHDAAIVAASAHQLKSSSATLGAARMAALCQALEFAGSKSDLGHATTLAEKLRDEHTKVTAELSMRFPRG